MAGLAIFETCLISIMQIVAPCPGVALVVPIGRLEELSCGRCYFIIFSMIRDVKLVCLNIINQFMDVIIGIRDFHVAIVALNYFLSQNWKYSFLFVGFIFNKKINTHKYWSKIVTVLGTEFFLSLVKKHFSIIKKIVAVHKVLDHLGGTFFAAFQAVEPRRMVKVHHPFILGAGFTLLIFVF